mmetsp:Transcript_11159/g.20949  ORF Transcript_11159/g.20949 Transcript_11159/m.20949 type:complete len:82 (-) Transcript_11159:151-396(-)
MTVLLQMQHWKVLGLDKAKKCSWLKQFNILADKYLNIDMLPNERFEYPTFINMCNAVLNVYRSFKWLMSFSSKRFVLKMAT